MKQATQEYPLLHTGALWTICPGGARAVLFCMTRKSIPNMPITAQSLTMTGQDIEQCAAIGDRRLVTSAPGS